MTPETIGITVTYKTPTTFHLRMIGVAEESKLRQKLFGLTEDEQAEKSYQNNVNMLADLSEKMPQGMFASKPKEMEVGEQARSSETFIEDFSTPADAVRHFFKDKSILKERIAEYAVLGYFARLKPDVSFL